VPQRILPLLALLACEPTTPTLEGEPDARSDAAVFDSRPPDAGPDARPDVAPDLAADAAPDLAADVALADPCPVDHPEGAPSLSPGVPHTDKICRGRSAWYRLDVPAGHSASAVLAFRHAAGDLELRLFAADGELLAESVSATDTERVAGPVGVEATHVSIEVFGYRGAGGVFVITPRLHDVREAREVRVEGHVRFEDRPFGPEGFTGERVPSPARSVTVELVRDEDGAVVGEAVTGADGGFVLDAAAQPVPHTVRAASELRHRGFVTRVHGADDGLPYAVSAPLVPGEPVALLAGADDAVGGALNILDAAHDAFATIADFVPGPSPPLTYRWTPGRAFGCGSCYSDDTIRLGGQLEDPDEYDDVIILHELGHYFVSHFSRDDSPGGTHRDMAVSPLLAYGEGLAYFFATLVRDEPYVVDTFIDHVRSIDIEAMTVGGRPDETLSGTRGDHPAGDYREELVAGLMWDAYDAPSEDEPHDALALGAADTLHLLIDVLPQPGGDVGPRGMELTDWLNALACFAGAEPVQPLIDERDFPWDLAERLECRKGRVPAPYGLERRAGGIWLVGEAPSGAPLRVVSGTDRRKLRGGPVRCTAPCRLADARPDLQLVVTSPGAPWAGASWLGKDAAAALLGGRVVAGARTYPSQ